MEDNLEYLKEDKYYTSNDLYNWHWESTLDEICKNITVFTSKMGKTRFQVMPFGLMKTPATFKRILTEVSD